MSTKTNPKTLNPVEQESIILNTAWGMIDGMVNFEILREEKIFSAPMFYFNSRTHSELFVIRFADFLSPIRLLGSKNPSFTLHEAPHSASELDQSFIFQLRQVCKHPTLGSDSSCLSEKVEELAAWLGKCIVAKKVNLSAIDIVADIEVEYFKYIKMCGTIAKHNPARLDRVTKDLHELLVNAGHQVSVQDAHFALEQFFDWFFQYLFHFHANHIFELLNDVRWRIFQYLQREYNRSVHEINADIGDYAYQVPPSVKHPVAHLMYWELMNRVKRTPYVPPFVIDDSIKCLHPKERLPKKSVCGIST